MPAAASGRFEQVLLRSGAQLNKDTVLLVLTAPALRNSALEAEYQVKDAAVRVEVKPVGELPSGARPNLKVDGTIE